MRSSTLVVGLACAALALPGAAHAKGATKATIEGEGLLGGGITLTSGGGTSDGSLGRLADGAGFYPAVFSQTPDPMEPARPKGELGPRYIVTYTVPGPDSQSFELRQALYPYADGGPVTYMAPGQRVFDSSTRGGWFRAQPYLKPLLVGAGLPAATHRKSTGSGVAVSWPAVGLVALGVGLLGGALLVVFRRRPGPLAAR
jgi:hypothetical protein